MEINRLRLRNFRGFKDAEFHFNPGMNLIVGINGAGKSTVLDALSIAFSKILPKFTVSDSKDNRLSFTANDITIGYKKLEVDVDFQASGIPFECNIWFAKSDNFKIKPDSEHILDTIKNAENQPLVVYFATQRSIITVKKYKEKDMYKMASGDPSAAFPEALKPRNLRLTEFTDWYLAQNALLNENYSPAKRSIEALNKAVTSFLDQFTNLRVVGKSDLVLDKDGLTLNINQLSEGERGLLALILDLVKRLLQANPDLEDPLKDGKAVVLIDELDLHLHPRWQRMVVKKLTEIFPSCQFIATTHSPQIIGEVEPTGLTLLQKEGDRILVKQKGLQSFGLDSSWILKHLMETEPRNFRVQSQINSIEDALEEGDLDSARNKLDALKDMIYGRDDQVIRLEASINNLEALADEVDSEEE